MTVLDTNVLSEVIKPAPEAAVLLWFAEQEALNTFTTTITVAEILFGVESLPAGKRRVGLAAAVNRILAEEFDGRILSFDEDAARAYSKIVVSRKAGGRPISQFDAMIAGIAQSRGASLATRNTADFEGCGVGVVNPWA